MRLYFDVETNYPDLPPKTDTLFLLKNDGKLYEIDCTQTNYKYDKKANLLRMDWQDAYLWTENEDGSFTEEWIRRGFFNDATFDHFTYEGDAPDDYYAKPVKILAYNREIPIPESEE